jgi:hypothetical protein
MSVGWFSTFRSALSSAGRVVINVTAFDRHTVTCSCKEALARSGNRHRRSEGEAAGTCHSSFLVFLRSLTLTTTPQVYTIGEVIVTEFIETLMTADDLTTASLAAGSQIVLFMFGVLWGVGLAAISFHQKRKEQIAIENRTFSRARAGAMGNEALPPETDMISSLQSDVEESFPSVYHSKSSFPTDGH